MAHINKTIEKVSKGPSETNFQEKIAALRTELHEIYKRAQEGRELLTDERRADDIAYELRELTEQ